LSPNHVPPAAVPVVQSTGSATGPVATGAGAPATRSAKSIRVRSSLSWFAGADLLVVQAGNVPLANPDGADSPRSGGTDSTTWGAALLSHESTTALVATSYGSTSHCCVSVGYTLLDSNGQTLGSLDGYQVNGEPGSLLGSQTEELQFESGGGQPITLQSGDRIQIQFVFTNSPNGGGGGTEQFTSVTIP